MKALLLEKKNELPAIKELPDPLLKAGRVIIRVKAAALNHRDVWIMKGQYAGISYPIVLGSDGAGIVEEVGKDVPKELVGEKVVINPSMNWGDNDLFQGKDYKILGLPDNGTFSELVAVPQEYVHPMPAHLTFEQAAAMPLAGLTAYRALFMRAGLKAGEKVLITGIGGGVALAALQYAVALGCPTWVTSSSQSKIKDATSMGAQGGVNYRDKDWVKELKAQAKGFDVILDGAGGPGFAGLVDLARPGARISLYGGTAGNYEGLSPQKIFWKQISILGSTMGSPTDFHNMLRFVEAHQIVPVVDDVFALEDGAEAFQRMSESRQFGKIVLRVEEP